MKYETMLCEFDSPIMVKRGDLSIEIEIHPLSERDQEVARNELRETPEHKKTALADLRNLLQEERNLQIPLENDEWLIKFLRPCKYYPESAKELIKRYYSFKVKHKEIYNNLTPSREMNIFKQNILTTLKNRDQFGRRMLVLELGKRWKHKEVTLDEVFKGCVLFLEGAMWEPCTQVNGSVIILDMDGLSLQQSWQFTPQFAKRIVDWLQDAVPLRVKNLHIVNQPKIFNVVFALFKPFLREKLRSRIIFHGSDKASLHKYIDPRCLPPTYGGSFDEPQPNGELWYELLVQCEREYEAINSYGYINNNIK